MNNVVCPLSAFRSAAVVRNARSQLSLLSIISKRSRCKSCLSRRYRRPKALSRTTGGKPTTSRFLRHRVRALCRHRALWTGAHQWSSLPVTRVLRNTDGHWWFTSRNGFACTRRTSRPRPPLLIVAEENDFGTTTRRLMWCGWNVRARVCRRGVRF